MIEFTVGLCIGLVAGGTMGAILMAAMCVAGRADRNIEAMMQAEGKDNNDSTNRTV